jgi:hypothetical protein
VEILWGRFYHIILFTGLYICMKNGSLEGQDELAITVQNLDKFRAIALPHLK